MFSFFDISSSLWQTFFISFLSLLNPWNLMEDDTKKQIVYYTVLLIILSYAPLYSNLIGYIYLSIASILNFILIRSAFKLKNSVELKDQPNSEGLRFFALTIFYLFSLFSALLIDNLILL